MNRDDETLLTITFFDGEYMGDDALLTYICEVEGSVVPDSRPPFTLLQETMKVLEICADRYSAVRPSGDCFTVIIGRKAAGTEGDPLVRLDGYACNGYASASVLSSHAPCSDMEPVRYLPDDDVVTIAYKILKGNLCCGQ
jgi:hypothetical protein